MSYTHSQDLSEEKTINVPEWDKQMVTVVNRTANALELIETLDVTFRSLLASHLRIFLSTHKSIRLLLSKKDEDIRFGSDAVSLAREQVEKVFLVTLIISDPEKWVENYFKSDFKTFYEHHLLQRAERQSLNRHKWFFNEYAPEAIERMTKAFNVSPLELQAIEFKFNNPGKPMPTHLKQALIQDFPTPGRVRNLLKNSPAERFLDRWHKEYKRLCGYSHVGMDKVQLDTMTDRRLPFSESRVNTFFEKQILEWFIISYVATASACAEVFPLLSLDIEVVAALTTFWERLRESTLIGKVFWDIRVQYLLPPTIGI